MDRAASFRFGQMPGQDAQDQHAGELVGMQSGLQIGFPARSRRTEAQYRQTVRRAGQLVALAYHGFQFTRLIRLRAFGSPTGGVNTSPAGSANTSVS